MAASRVAAARSALSLSPGGARSWAVVTDAPARCAPHARTLASRQSGEACGDVVRPRSFFIDFLY